MRYDSDRDLPPPNGSGAHRCGAASGRGPSGAATPHRSQGPQRSEQMCTSVVSENLWFRDMLGWTSARRRSPPARSAWSSSTATRGFGGAAWTRCDVRRRPGGGVGPLLRVLRSRAWILLAAYRPYRAPPGPADDPAGASSPGALRTYGPTADTGGLHGQPGSTVYPYLMTRPARWGGSGWPEAITPGSGVLSGHRATRLSCDASAGSGIKQASGPQGPCVWISARGESV